MKLKKLSKKAQLSGLSGSILAIVFATIILVFGFVIVQELRDTQGTTTDAYTIANDTLTGLGSFADFWTIIVLAVVIGVVLTILIGVFGRRGR